MVQRFSCSGILSKRYISIHLMLWFNGNRSTLTYTVNSNFNTSYVVVQPRVSRIALQRGTNFNTSYVVVQRHSAHADAYAEWNFNTSYVVVQPVVISTVVGTTVDFNTSYVVVQPGIPISSR